MPPGVTIPKRTNSDNSFVSSRLVGEPVQYGQVIQLFHVSTQKFLTIKRTAADVERGALKVVLFDGGTQGSWFNLMPGFRTKLEGDKCLFGDIIELESSTFNGMGLHISVVPITAQNMLPVTKSPYVQQSWELTATPDIAQWKLTPHSLHESILTERCLEGFSAVKIVHKTSNNVLVCDGGGVFFQSALSENVQGNAIFQIEPVDLQWSGMALKFEVWVRLKNLVTNQYLCGGDPIETDGKGLKNVTLSEKYNHPRCMWKLYSFAKGGQAELGEEAFAYISNQDGSWLSQGQGMMDQSGTTDAIVDVSLAAMRPECLDKDVVAICKIDNEIVDKLVVVRHCMNTLQSFLHALNALPPMGVTAQHQVQEIKAAANRNGLVRVFTAKYPQVEVILLEMISNLSPLDSQSGSGHVVAYQRLARETRLMNVVLECLGELDFHVFFGEARNTSVGRQVVKFGSSCHKLLQLCCLENKANQSYIAPYQELLKGHLGGPVKAADTLAAIYDNNMEQIQNVDESVIVSFTDLIRETGFKPRFINFLRTICGTPDMPVPKNQNLLIHHLFKDPLQIFFSAELSVHNPSSILGFTVNQEAHETWVLHVSEDGDIFDIDCSEFFGYEDDVNKPDIFSWDRSEAFLSKHKVHGLYIYYIFTLHLFSALCFGRNISAHEELLRASSQYKLGLEFAPMLTIIRSPHLPYTLRTAALDICMSLYVDIDPYHPLQLPKMTRLLWETNEVLPAMLSEGTQSKQASSAGIKSEGDDHIELLIQSLVDFMNAVAKTAVNTNNTIGIGIQTPMEIKLAGDGVEEQFNFRKPPEKLKESTASEVLVPIAEGVEEAEQDMDSDGAQCFLLRGVAALETMLKLGLLKLDQPHMKKLLPDLLKVLCRVEAEGFASSEATESTGLTLIRVKQAILYLMDFALDLQLERMLQEVFDGFAEYHQRVLETGMDEAQGNLDDDMDLDGFSVDEEVVADDNLRLLKKVTSTKVSPILENNKNKAMGKIISDLVKSIHRGQSHGFPFLKFDPFEYKNLKGPVVDLIGLMKYDNPALGSQSIKLIERLLSRRKKFLEVVVQTHIIPDEESTLLFKVSEKLLNQLRHWYRWVGSTNEERRKEAMDTCKACVGELTKVLSPGFKLSVVVDGVRRDILITKGKATNFQSALYDLSAHSIMLTFLKLPLRRRTQVDSNGECGMDQAEDVDRRELFGLCYFFLKNFSVVVTATQSIPNERNQKALFTYIDLFLSHLGVQNLNVADTISSLFTSNPVLASCIGNEVLQKFAKLIVRYGEKKRARWLRFLRSIIVVNETPIKENQASVLHLAAKYKEHFCSFFNENDVTRRQRLDLLKADEHLNHREDGANAQGSMLSYHQECVQLLAECCIGMIYPLPSPPSLSLLICIFLTNKYSGLHQRGCPHCCTTTG